MTNEVNVRQNNVHVYRTVVRTLSENNVRIVRIASWSLLCCRKISVRPSVHLSGIVPK